MTKKTDKISRAVASSGAALAAVMLGAPAVAATDSAQAAGTAERAQDLRSATSAGPSANRWKVGGQARAVSTIKFKSEYKHKGEYSIVGKSGARTIFKDDRRNLFYVDEVTGDQKFVALDMFLKIDSKRSDYVYHTIKLRGKVTILGVDQAGKLLMRNKAGETFHLDAATGDMIFVK